MRHCLIIDDQNQNDQIELLELESKKQQFPVKGYFFNISNPIYTRTEIKNGVPEILIDIDKVINKLKELYGDKEIDLIACDYDFSDNFIDGLKLIQELKGVKFKGQKMPYLIYSNDFELVKTKLQQNVKDIVEDKDGLMSFLESYFESKPNSVTNRTKYYEAIIEFLKRNKTPLDIKLESKLLEQPDKVFENIFPRFHGKTLRELANLLRKSTEESDDFESEFLERSVAHFIHLEK